MSTDFPTSLDSLTNPATDDTLDDPSHAAQHANSNDAIEALEAKVGVNSSAVSSSHDYKIEQLDETFAKCVNRQDNTSNSTMSDQLVQMGWGFIQGDGSSYSLSEAVTFPVAYDNYPIVIISSAGGIVSSDPTEIDDFVTSAPTANYTSISITASGFTALLNRVSNDGGSPGVLPTVARYGYSWIAIGTKSR